MIKDFFKDIERLISVLPCEEIEKALHLLHGVYERDGRIYVFGNGGSLALASHWVNDFNKTVFNSFLTKEHKRFQAMRLPSSDSELTAWANDVGYEMIFAGPLKNYIQGCDLVIAISSSGNSSNVIKAVELAKSYEVPIVGLSGFDKENKLNELSDAKIYVPTEHGKYEIVESIHGMILHAMTKYFKEYFVYEMHTL